MALCSPVVEKHFTRKQKQNGSNVFCSWRKELLYLAFFTLTLGMQNKSLMLPSIYHQKFVRLSSEVATDDMARVQVVLVRK